MLNAFHQIGNCPNHKWTQVHNSKEACMPLMKLSNVTLIFTQNMTRESEYGGWNYSFVIDKSEFCNKVRDALETQKKQVWASSKNTDAFILSKCNAKSKDNVTYEPAAAMMGDNDILVQVNSKNAPIENSKMVPLGRGTTADILIDVFEYEYGKKQFICIRSHAERGCTVKVNDLKEHASAIKYFDYEATDTGIADNIDSVYQTEEEPF